MGYSRPLFIYFRLFNTVDNKQVNRQMFNKILPMPGVKPKTSGIKSNCSTNWAKTTSLRRFIFQLFFIQTLKFRPFRYNFQSNPHGFDLFCLSHFSLCWMVRTCASYKGIKYKKSSNQGRMSWVYANNVTRW